MFSCFSERLAWSDFSLLFQRISERLSLLVPDDLLPLMAGLPSLKPERARILVKDFAVQSTNDIVNIVNGPDAIFKAFIKSEGFKYDEDYQTLSDFD